MKTIKQYVDSGINTVSDLKDALRLAMQLEFATIPPYLCAQWSIKNDPDRVEGVLHKIVGQEMNHFALAGNLLASIGGRPSVANAKFVPRYPAASLPGGIAQRLPVDLRPLDRNQLKVFMQIEYPDFPPVALLATRGPATIGAFYDTIIAAFQNLNPLIDPNACAVDVVFSKRITNVADAIEVIDRIKSEGEGLRDSPDQPSGDHAGHAHYYLFKEIFVQRRLIKVGGQWKFSGDPIKLPEVYRFRKTKDGADLAAAFNRALSELLVDLEACWVSGIPPNVPGMFKLEMLGRKLIKKGIRPEFRWDASVLHHNSRAD